MLQLVSHHVIEIQDIGFAKFGMKLWILAGNVVTCFEPLLNRQCCLKLWGLWLHLKGIFFLGLGVTVTEINIKNYRNKT